MERHGRHAPRGIQRGVHVPRSTRQQGRFGRIFRNLAAYGDVDDGDLAAALGELTADGGPMVDPQHGDGYGGDTGDSAIPAGYTYLGQFIDHDITMDPTSSLDRANDPDALHNFRTPRLELDSIYGAGPAATPQLYDGGADAPTGRLLVDAGPPRDLPRNRQGTALIGDPRNDENRIVGQLQLAFIQLHNALLAANVDQGRADAFAHAQQQVRWHHQWLVVHDFLPRIAAPAVVADVAGADRGDLDELKGGVPAYAPRFYHPRHEVFMPVEFSVGAYRFGHSMARERYQVNQRTDAVLFTDHEGRGRPHLGGGSPLPGELAIDWSRFFDGGGHSPQPARRIDPRLAASLFSLPFVDEEGELSSLAYRNIQRGFALGVPSGQAVARAMGERPLGNGELGLDGLTDPVWGGEAPLWLYVLGEAATEGAGDRLGPVGGRLVTEVLLGLIHHDPLSYWNVNPRWQPEPPIASARGELTAGDVATASQRLGR